MQEHNERQRKLSSKAVAIILPIISALAMGSGLTKDKNWVFRH